MLLTIEEYFHQASDKLAIYRSDPEDNTKEHFHEFDEIVIVTGGRGFHVLNGTPYFIKCGDVFIVQQKDYHFYDEINELKLINILLNPTKNFHYIKPLSNILSKLQIGHHHTPHWLGELDMKIAIKMADEIFESYQENKNHINHEIIQESIFYRLLIFILSRNNKSADNSYKIHRLLSHIEHNYQKNINWEKIAEKYHFSYRTLHRHIKRLTGMTPDNFLKRLRLIYARKLLLESDNTITDIALKCGFSSNSHFSTRYREIFGKSPSQEREIK